MLGKKLLIAALMMPILSFGLGEKFSGEQRTQHDCFKNLRKNDGALYKFVEGVDGTYTLQKVDTSRNEQINSGIRAFALSTLIGFIAQGYSKNNHGEAWPHILGLITTVAANLFIGGIACQDRKIMTQVGGGLTGYIVGSVGRASAS